MKFDKTESKKDGSVHTSSKAPYRMCISTAPRGRTYIIFHKLARNRNRLIHPGVPEYDWGHISPTLRVEHNDTALFAQVLKELMLVIGRLPDKPTNTQLRTAIREVAYKYGEPTDAAQTNFLCSISKLNDKKRKVKWKGRLHDIIHKGIRANTLAGKDKQLWELAKMVEP